MRLSFYTYSYTDRLNLSIPACLERIARTGYSGIDVSGTHGDSDDPRSFDRDRRILTRRTAEKWNLRVEAVVSHAQLTDTLADPNRPPLDLAGTIDLAAELGANVATFHMGGDHEGVAREKTWQSVVAAVKTAADRGAQKHVVLAVDGIWPTWIVDTPAALERLFDDVEHPNFGINFDPSYLTLMGVDPVEFAKQFKSRIAHAHLKDHMGKFPKWTHVLPGRGEMDYGRVFRGLSEAGFNESAAVECFTTMEFEQACDDGYRAMVAAAENAGVRFQTNRPC